MNPLYANDTRGQHAPSYYAATAHIPAPLPPLKGRRTVDVAIIGAGYAGLSAALELAQRGYNVAVLEAHRIGFGASGRNGGQVAPGFNQSMEWIEQRLGTAKAHTLWDLSLNAVSLTRDLARRHGDAQIAKGVAFGAWSASEADDASREADHLAETYGYEQIETLDTAAFQARVKSPVYQGGTLDHGAFHLHPLRYALGLAQAARDAGAVIYENSAVHHVDARSPAVIRTDAGSLTADHVIMATNGYGAALDRKVAARTMPINSFIGATPPLPDPAKVIDGTMAVADDRAILNYFRISADNRLLFGGRENYGIKFPRDITTRLQARMARLFPQLDSTGFDYVWGGTLGITRHRLPALMRIGQTGLSIGGFSGHGIALATLSGQIAAQAVAGQAERFDTLADLPTPAFPGGGFLRAPLLGAAMGLAVLRDRLG